jgi:hypothetical protein
MNVTMNAKRRIQVLCQGLIMQLFKHSGRDLDKANDINLRNTSKINYFCFQNTNKQLLSTTCVAIRQTTS